jgi:monoamine oxidase
MTGVGNHDADVIVVGAGFAGLAAARRLCDAGLRPLVLEARDRVGGRVYTEIHDGVPLDLGGQWLGPTQTRAMELARELGIALFRQHVAGRNVIDLGGRRRFFRGTVPTVGPLALASIGWTWWRLDRIARQVPLEAPWTAPHAAAWDAQTLDSFLRRNAPSATARKLLRYGLETVFAADPADLSLLHAAFYIRSGGNLDRLLSTEGGAQQDRVVGGMQRFAEALAAQVREHIRFSTPVRVIVQNGTCVEVRSDRDSFSARRVIVALPPMLAGRLRYEPAMPASRDQLTQRVPQGAVIKCLAVYDEPFWRAAGLSGHGITDVGPAHIHFDASPPAGEGAAGSAGVLLAFIEGHAARAWSGRPAEQRREAVLRSMARCFGERALRPVRYLDKSWAEDEWARGCYAGYFPPGVWTSSGAALRAPVGRIHWAGTETSSVWNGYIEGAIRSGERAADEVAALEAGTRMRPGADAGAASAT